MDTSALRMGNSTPETPARNLPRACQTPPTTCPEPAIRQPGSSRENPGACPTPARVLPRTSRDLPKSYRPPPSRPIYHAFGAVSGRPRMRLEMMFHCTSCEPPAMPPALEANRLRVAASSSRSEVLALPAQALVAHDLHGQLGAVRRRNEPTFFMIEAVALGPRLRPRASAAARAMVSLKALASISKSMIRWRRSASATRPLSSTPT